MAVEMLHDLETRNFHVKQLIMDNDSTTFAKAKASFDPNIKKISDFNHTKKNLISKLYDIKKPEKVSSIRPKNYSISFNILLYNSKFSSSNINL